VLEAGGYAAAYYGNAAGNMVSPNSSLPNGNRDLPGTRINFVQSGQVGFTLPGGQLPQGNPPAQIGLQSNGRPRTISNHASEVSGVIMGQGVAGPADLGISPGAGLSFAALDPSINGRPAEDNDAATAMQLVLQARNTPIVNNSWGFVEQNGAGN